jgi:chromosome segregation ATPase
MSDSAKSHDIQGALEDVAELEEKLELMHQQNAGWIVRGMELEEQIKAKDDYIVKLQLRLIRIETVAQQVHEAFTPGARLPHEQTKALTDLAIAVREQPAEPAPELNRLRGELLEVHDKLAHADNEIETLQQVIANLNEANATLARERNQASAHFNAAERALGDAKAETERLQRREAEHLELAQRVKEAAEAQQAEVERLKAIIDRDNYLRPLEAEIERLKRERPSGEELAAMQALAHSQAEEIARLKGEVNVLETDRDFPA